MCVCAGACVQTSAVSVHAVCAVSLCDQRPPPSPLAGVCRQLESGVECVCVEGVRVDEEVPQRSCPEAEQVS